MADGVETVSLKPRTPDRQAQLYYADGTPIAPADVAGAVQRGEAFSTGDDVRINVDGSTGKVPASGLANFLAQRNATVETEREAKTRELSQSAQSIGGMAATAGEGLVRGATMGFVEPALMYDDEGRQAALLRQRLNPKIAGGSELAGAIGAAIASTALTGGAGAGVTSGRLASLAARGALTPWRAAALLGDAAEAGAAALGAGRGVLGTGARLAARGAAEGALMGVGQEVSRATLEDVPLTAERLLAGAWDGAKLGGAFGGGIGLLGAGVGKAGRAIIGHMAETGDDVGKSVGTWAERRAFKQAVGNNGKIFDRASNFGQDTARPARIGRKLLDAKMPAETGAALRRAGELADDAAGRMKTVAAAMDESGVIADTGHILGAIDDQIAKLRETPIGDFQAIADRVEKQIAPFRARMTPTPGAANDTVPSLKFSELWQMRQNLDKTLNWEVKARGPAQEALRDMVGAFRSEIDDTIARAAKAETVSPDLLGAWKKATEDYGDFALARDGLKELTKRQAKNRWMSPTDYGTGGAAGMLVGILSGSPVAGVVTSAVAGAAHKLIRERGAGVIARIADRAAGVAGQMELAGKMAALVEAPKRIAAPVAVNVAQQFERYSGLLAQAQTQPAEFAKRVGDVTADLALRAPELAAQVSQTMVADAAYLAEIHPQPPSRKSSTLTPMAVPAATYAFNQKANFVEAAMALDHPIGVFEEIANGELPLAGIQALKARRPALWTEMRAVVIKYATQREEELPFNRRMLLGTAFDFPADWSMLHIGDIQQAQAQAPQSPNDPRAAPSKVNPNPAMGIAPGKF